ncbi:uncharacterized protein [Dysidea avara]|uniref:uncharacterized protein isoform X1 n=2 Tax=Dysidea avara TaxID=196820 RepID=UPI0033269D0E
MEEKLANVWVCECHFVARKPADTMDKHNVDWFPTLELGHSKLDVAVVHAASERASEREARAKERNKRVFEVNSNISTSGSTSASTLATTSSTSTTTTSNSTSTSTITTMSTIMSTTNSTLITNPTFILTNGTLTSTSTTTGQSSQLSLNSNSGLIDHAIQTADGETQTPRPPKMCNKAVQTDDDNFFCENNIMSDDAKVQYYTGLATSLLLLKTFELVMGSFALGDKRSYYWRSFMIVLMKLRLNLGLQDIAYRLGICTSTVSRRRFHEMLDIMSCRLEWLIKWPEREELWKTMPSCFRATYGTKVVAVIDCFEIKIETPSHLVAKSSTWSQYKHANTAKVFIAMCPQGVTSFISPAWGGRVSDKLLTVNSGFLNKLLPGDCVLADRGFDIAEDVARMQETLHIPSFIRGCSQLSPIDVEATRKLANVRIHIERVIGATRQRYSILMSCIPIDFLKPKHLATNHQSIK